VHATCHADLVLLDLIALILFGEECNFLGSWVTWFFYPPVRFSLLCLDFLLCIPFFKYTQLVFISWCKRPIFRAIQKSLWNYNYILRITKFLDFVHRPVKSKGKVQKPSNSECNTPSSEPIRIYLQFYIFHKFQHKTGNSPAVSELHVYADVIQH
jgi:hypothetical protein